MISLISSGQRHKRFMDPTFLSITTERIKLQDMEEEPTFYQAKSQYHVKIQENTSPKDFTMQEIQLKNSTIISIMFIKKSNKPILKQKSSKSMVSTLVAHGQRIIQTMSKDPRLFKKEFITLPIINSWCLISKSQPQHLFSGSMSLIFLNFWMKSSCMSLSMPKEPLNKFSLSKQLLIQPSLNFQGYKDYKRTLLKAWS